LLLLGIISTFKVIKQFWLLIGFYQSQ